MFWVILDVQQHMFWVILDVQQHMFWVILDVQQHMFWVILDVQQHMFWVPSACPRQPKTVFLQCRSRSSHLLGALMAGAIPKLSRSLRACGDVQPGRKCMRASYLIRHLCL